MHLVLALTSAAVFGAADFAGGLGARRTGAFVTTVASQACGLLALAAVLAFLPGRPDPTSLAWGAAAGVAGGSGLVLFFRAMATGPMGVVSPLTAALTAGVPLVGGLLLGDRPGPLALAGVVLGVGAVVLGSRDPSAPGGRLAPGVLAATIAAGSAFGLFFILLANSTPIAGLWPLLAARGASLSLLGLVALTLRRRVHPAPGTIGVVALSGVLDMAANVAYLLAVQQGLLSITAVLASLYPLSTVVLSRMVLGERLAGVQRVGVVLALGAVVLVAVA